MGDDQRQALLDSIRGQTVLMPNLRPIFEDYTVQRNPNYEAMVPVVNARLESLVFNEKRLAKLKTADFALFASYWWPKADFHGLRIVCFLAIWLFLWDDHLDEPTGDFADNFEGAQRYRKETLKFLADVLGLNTSTEITTVVTYPMFGSFKGFGKTLIDVLEYVLGSGTSQATSKPSLGIFGNFKALRQNLKSAFEWGLGIKYSPKVTPKASHPIIESFRVIGDAAKAAYTIEQRQNFFEDLKFYIDCTEIEQRFKFDGHTPTIEEYWEARMGTSALAACLSMIEFAGHVKGPYNSTNHPLLKPVNDEANIIVIIANDMLSLQKEMKQGCVDSLIPLLTPACGGVQQALDQCHVDLLAAVDRFNAEEKKILSGPNTTVMTDREVRMFIDGCRDIWVGNIKWSLTTGRYGMCEIDQKNGSFPILL